MKIDISERLKQRLLDNNNRSSLCSLCKHNSVENGCPYKERIKAMKELMDNANPISTFIEEKLGPNPFKDKYFRYQFPYGPIIYCESYEKGKIEEVFKDRYSFIDNTKIFIVGNPTKERTLFEETCKNLEKNGYFVMYPYLFTQNYQKITEEDLHEAIPSDLEKAWMCDEVLIFDDIDNMDYFTEKIVKTIKIVFDKPIKYIKESEIVDYVCD